MDFGRQAATAFRLDKQKLQALAQELRPQFVAAEPFPHFVAKDFLPADVAAAVAAEFPRLGEIDWKLVGPGDAAHTNNPEIEKVLCSDEAEFPPLIRTVMHELNSATFLDFLMSATGYQGVVSDPWFGGCGLHSTGNGGRLMVHADMDRHPNSSFYQILNVIYYATPNWQGEWGGHLELWDRQAKNCVKKVAPEFNSLIAFYTGPKSFHGHPLPLRTPPGVRRNTLAAYYYTPDASSRPDDAGRIPDVMWKSTNELDRVTLKRHILRGAQAVLPGRVFERAVRVWEALTQ